MATTRAISVQDGPRLTVSTMVKQPTVIPKRLISMMQQQFIVDALLRRLPPTASGAYVYEESTPLFADGDAPIVEEFGEIPTISGRVGARKVALTVKRALALKVSQEMVNRNSVDRVNTQMTQIKNTFVRTWETAFLTAVFAHPDVHTVPATAVWSGGTADIRSDLLAASTAIEDSAPTDDTDNYFGFEPDTLVIGRVSKNELLNSDDFLKVFVDSLAPESPQYKGTLPGRFFNMDNIMVSRELDRIAPGKALVLQRKVAGGIGDERPLRSTPLYEHKPTETWRSDTVRQSAIVLDQPKAVAVLTGVYTP